MKQGTGTIAALVAGSVAAAGMAVSPMMAVTGFDLYEPPDALGMVWYDYLESEGGGPSKGNAPTEYPTIQQEYPYRAVFFGAHKNSGSLQGYNSTVFVVLSKQPATDAFTFEYQETRGYYGSIRATAKSRSDIGWGKDVVVMMHSWAGVSSGQNRITMQSFTTHIRPTGDYYFEFDFYYPCCGQLSVSGASGVSECPYPYILTCKDSHGSSGGTSSSGSSSGGNSSGGSGSSGSGSGGSGDPGGSSSGSGSRPSTGGPGSMPEPSIPEETGDWDDWDDHPGGNESSYPWENDANISTPDWDPTVSEQPPGQEGDTGENGDTWELPEYSVSGLDDSPLNIPDMPDVNLVAPDLPEVSAPQLEYEPEGGGEWPPPYPGTGS